MSGAHRKIALDFITQQKIMTLSTVSTHGAPESAVVKFAETDRLELIFETFSTYRKYKNLQINQRVACVIGWDDKITVQYEGLATQVTDDEELEEVRQLLVKKSPSAIDFVGLPETVYFKIKPIWLRYRNFNTDPETLWEIDF